MMKRRKIAPDSVIFGIIFALGLFVRLLNLGVPPLSDFEASWALQSWAAVNGEEVHIGPNPGYFTLTTFLFSLLGSSNALARFWPALVGSLLVCVPFGFRRLLGREVAILMALGLALDPGLVAVSRIAGGPMMALGFFMISLVFLFHRHALWAGIFAGLSLISGSSFYLGFVGFLAAWWIARRLGFAPVTLNLNSERESQPSDTSPAYRLSALAIPAAVTVFLASTLFARFPAGLGALGSSLAAFFTGWIQTPTVPIFQPSLAVIFYQPLALIFALIAAVRAWIGGKSREQWLSIWLLAALILTVFYSQRSVFDAIWAIVPLWALASLELGRYIRIPDLPLPAFGQAGLLFVLGVIFWLVSTSSGLGELTWLVLLAVPVLAALTTVFVGLGWSWDSARTGAAWGVGLLLGLYTLSAAFGTAQRGQNSPAEFWYPPPGTGQAALLRETLAELALVDHGREDWIEVVSLVDSPSLKWLLRDIREVTYVSILDPGILPAVIFTPGNGTDLSQTMSYQGQDFNWSSRPAWAGPLPAALWDWITARIAPIKTDSIVMWARSDLFPQEPEQAGEGGESESLQRENPLEEGAPE
jgi:hypothetical protein